MYSLRHLKAVARTPPRLHADSFDFDLLVGHGKLQILQHPGSHRAAASNTYGSRMQLMCRRMHRRSQLPVGPGGSTKVCPRHGSCGHDGILLGRRRFDSLMSGFTFAGSDIARAGAGAIEGVMKMDVLTARNVTTMLSPVSSEKSHDGYKM